MEKGVWCDISYKSFDTSCCFFFAPEADEMGENF